MNCNNVKHIIDSWTDSGAVSPEAVQQVRDHMGICPTCDSVHRNAIALMERDAGITDRIYQNATTDDPGVFTSRTMDRVLHEPSASRHSRILKPALIAAVALFAVTVVFQIVRTVYLQPTIAVEFSLDAPKATSVHLVGDFNRWDPARNQLADEDNDGVWTARIRLKRGTIQSYNFVIDGDRWIPDPESLLRVDDGFGGTNSVIKL